jgi:predicted RecB family nuclease
LATQTGIPVEVVLELVKLSDLARLPGVKGIRARLYYDAGVDTVENLASFERYRSWWHGEIVPFHQRARHSYRSG